MSTLRILILEDDRDDAELMVATLSEAGLVTECQRAKNEEDFRRLLTPDFDLILADYTLPGYNALQALALLKERRINIPCIIVSGTIGEERAVECLRNGATDYILKDRMGRLAQAVGNALDAHSIMAAKHAAEEELRDTVILLEQRNAELERFSYTISHELRTPLVTIGGFLGLLKEGLGPECRARLTEELGFLDEATETLKTRIDLLLTLARAGMIKGELETIDLEQLVRQHLTTVQNPLQQNQIKVVVQPGLPALFANPLRVSEVLENLIDNAIKFMGDQAQPVVEIGGALEGEMVRCFVRDNGIGVEPVYQERVFRLFEQLDPKSAGEGIGLSLVRRIIETHGGKIWIESAGLGQGSTVFFTLPAAEPDAQDT